MDVEAIFYATNESLQDLGLTARGDIFAVKAFCQRQTKTHQNVDDSFEERKRKLFEELNKGREKVKSRKTSASSNSSHARNNASEPQKDRVKKRKITFGWMHYSSKEKRFFNGTTEQWRWYRRIDVPGNSTKEDLTAEAKQLFFQGGVSTHREEKEKIFDLAHFKAEPFEEVIEAII